MQPKEFNKQIDLIIKYSSKSNLLLKIIASSVVTFLIARFAPDFSITIPLWIWLIFKKNITFNKEKAKAFDMLKQAKKHYPDNIDKVVELLFKANNILKTVQISELIKKLPQTEISQELIELELLRQEQNNANDPKLSEIINETIKVLQYLINHKQELKLLEEKKSNIIKDKNQAPEHYKDELNNLITRYERIIDLEKSKISFYQQLYSELKQLKKDYYYRNKLIQEYEFLRKLEERYLSSSLRESQEAEAKNDFLDYQNAYLQALSKYAEEINNSESLDIFENLRKDFEKKKKEISQ
jgi:hypothetical protein